MKKITKHINESAVSLLEMATGSGKFIALSKDKRIYVMIRDRLQKSCFFFTPYTAISAEVDREFASPTRAESINAALADGFEVWHCEGFKDMQEWMKKMAKKYPPKKPASYGYNFKVVERRNHNALHALCSSQESAEKWIENKKAGQSLLDFIIIPPQTL